MKKLIYSKEDLDLILTLELEEKEEEIERLNNIINELEKYLEEEKDRLAGETSAIYEDSLGKTRLVNEDIFNEIIIIQDKIKALKGDSNYEIH